MTRILITGIAGFEGAHTLKHLLDCTDWDIVGTDSKAHNGDYRRVEAMLQFAQERNPQLKPKFTYLDADLTTVDPKEFARQVGPVDHIINFASETYVSDSIEHPASLVANNVNLCVAILEVARILRPRTFIQISTDEVYGTSDKIAPAEWSAQTPSNPYAASKAAQEVIATSYWRTYGVPVVIVNSVTTFGEMQDEGKYLPLLIRAALQGKAAKVFAVDGEMGSRMYLHARNHADALLFILENLPAATYEPAEGQTRPDRYHIAGERFSNLEFARRVADAVKRPLKYKLVDSYTARTGYDLHYGLDGTKLEEAGWRPPMSFEESLRTSVQHHLDHPEWATWRLGSKPKK